MVEKELDASSNKSWLFVIRFLGFFLSVTIVYFIAIWTIEISKVKVEDLPVISVLNKDFKTSPQNEHNDIENLDLTINIIKEGKLPHNYLDHKIQNTIEPKLLVEEQAVPLDLKEELQNSINEALKSLEKEEIITSDKSFYLYLGSFNTLNYADKKLSELIKIEKLNLITDFSIIKKITEDNNSNYSIISIDNFFHDKALDYCEEISSYNLECKIISDL